MQYRFGKQYVLKQLVHQLSSLFIIEKSDIDLLEKYFDRVLDRLVVCFSASSNKYYSKESDNRKEVYFDPLHSCQWFMFLYYYANTISKNEIGNEMARKICDEIYSLSKMQSGADLYYEVDMPDVFMCDHPVGTVIGRAQYSNGFTFSQGNTIGNNHGVYPVIGENVVMMSNSKILGNSNIGNNVIISANAYVKDQDIPSDSIVFGTSPNLIIKSRHII